MFVEFTQANLFNLKPPFQRIWINTAHVLWIRPYENVRQKRDERGTPLPWAEDGSHIEHFPCVAIGYGPTLELDGGEIIVTESLETVLANLRRTG